MLLAALLLAGALQLSVALFGWSDAAASNQRVLSVTAEPAVIPARGGESTITVRLPASAANGETRVTLSTQLGVFTVLTGPSEIRHDLSDMGDDTLGAAVMLIADGHSGSTVVRAQVGSLVNTVTVHFVGETTSLRLEQPGPNARLDASRAHRVQLVASDETGLGAPRAEVALEITAAPAGATLRSGTQSSTTSLTLRADRFGKVSTLLTSPPGTVRLRARSDNASLDLELSLYGPPHTLRLVAIEGDSLERGQPGLIQALLLDEMGQGVPNQQIVFSAVGNLQIDREGADEPVTTDASGAARVHLDTANARLGSRRSTRHGSAPISASATRWTSASLDRPQPCTWPARSPTARSARRCSRNSATPRATASRPGSSTSSDSRSPVAIGCAGAH